MLYAHLLGMRRIGDQEDTHVPTEQLPMYAAVLRAWRRIAREEQGGRTWGAYQHYGNPYLRFFDPRGIQRTGTVSKNDRVPGADR